MSEVIIAIKLTREDQRKLYRMARELEVDIHQLVHQLINKEGAK